MAEKKRNGEIDFLRFVFALVILFYHFNSNYKLGFFVNGYIGVEFFFVVTGFLMARHAERRKETGRELSLVADETWRYVLGKVKAFFRYYTAAVLLQVLVRFVLLRHDRIVKVIYQFLGSIPTFTLTFMGLNNNRRFLYVGNTWYLSAMLIAIFLLFPLLLRHYDFSVKIVFPLIALFVIGYVYGTTDTISGWNEWTGFTYTGVLRAISEIALGGSLYALSAVLPQKCRWLVSPDSRAVTLLITLFKACCYAAVIAFAYGTVMGITFKNFFSLHALLICALGVLLSFSNAGYCIPDSGLTRYLGKLSLPIFIFHGFIRWSFWDVIGHAGISARLFAFLVVSGVVLSVVLMYATDAVAFLFRKLRQRA